MTVTKQWFQHGDHNGVTHYKNLNGDGGSYCHKCDEAVPKHGWINEGGHRVCPADWIIEAANGTFYPVKPVMYLPSLRKPIQNY